jgi:hypothetical protein
VRAVQGAVAREAAAVFAVAALGPFAVGGGGACGAARAWRAGVRAAWAARGGCAAPRGERSSTTAA